MRASFAAAGAEPPGAPMKIYFAGPLFTPYERAYIDECAEQLRADGFDVFVPHEHELAQSDTTGAFIFAKDMGGLGPADAVLALLDGPMVDDGTACEIGIFYALMQSDPTKKGVVGLLTDLRGSRGESNGLNLFVEGCIEASGGEIVSSFEAALAVLRRLRG
ncbi:MAG TPA: nucleoside 2-deoxyribosyltransferase [Gaiellaceae bacterium]